MDHDILQIKRGIPTSSDYPYVQTYSLPGNKYYSVLEALIHIREDIDSTLAFRLGCRYKTCGLCAMEINGKPRIACLTKLRRQMTLGPLKGLPVVRDLVIDRRSFFEKIREYSIFIQPRNLLDPEQLNIPDALKQLARCRECLCCISGYHPYVFGKSEFESPYIFVKIAQAYYDPRDVIDRKEQARILGIEHYKGIKNIPCPFGVPIVKSAIMPLMVL